MGCFDVYSKSFFSIPRNFADLINGVVYAGKPVVDPKDLEAMETERISDEEEKSYYVDVSKIWNLNGTRLALFVVENQKYIDVGMVIRNMVTEALEYRKQLCDIKDYHKAANDVKEAEYLSKIAKEDMLTPIITVVVYLGDEPWIKPRELYDMLDVDERLKPFIYNYSLNLFDYHDYADSSIFEGEVAKLVEALQARNSEEATKKFINKNSFMKKTSAKLIGKLLGIKNLKKSEIITLKGEMINMCKAWDDHYNSGVKDGENRGKAKGMKEGEEKGRIDTLVQLVRDGLLSLSEAAKRANKNEDEFAKLLH